MIELQNNKTFEEFLSDVSNSLGVDLDTDSFDISILKVLFDYSSELNNQINQKINSRFFENLSGRNLEEFLSFFNVQRKRGGNNDIYEFNLFVSEEKTIKINSGSLLSFNGANYVTIKDEYLSSGLNVFKTYRGNNSQSINNPCFTREGEIQIDRSSIDVPEVENIEAFFSKNVKLVTFNPVYSEIESDLELLERSKNVMQSFGYSNINKIESELIKDSRIKNISSSDLNGVTEITIIPHSLNNIDSIVDYAQEVADYYKDKSIYIVKPSIVEFEIVDFEKQIIFNSQYETIMDSVMNRISFELSSNVDNIVYKSSIVNAIRDGVFSVDPTLIIDLSSIKVFYNFYNRSNYDISIVTEEVVNYKQVESDSVITIGNIR